MSKKKFERTKPHVNIGSRATSTTARPRSTAAITLL